MVKTSLASDNTTVEKTLKVFSSNQEKRFDKHLNDWLGSRKKLQIFVLRNCGHLVYTFINNQ